MKTSIIVFFRAITRIGTLTVRPSCPLSSWSAESRLLDDHKGTFRLHIPHDLDTADYSLLLSSMSQWLEFQRGSPTMCLQIANRYQFISHILSRSFKLIELINRLTWNIKNENDENGCFWCRHVFCFVWLARD